MIVRKKGKRDQPETELVRYDVYLHKRRDKRMIEHLARFREDRQVNSEARRLLYCGLDGSRSPMQTKDQERSAEYNAQGQPPPNFDTAPTTARGKMKRQFG